MSKRKFREGPPVMTLDDLMKVECIMFHGKVYHIGWFGSWPIRTAEARIGPNGGIRYAMPLGFDTRFSDEEILKATKRIGGAMTRAGIAHMMMVLNVFDVDGLSIDKVIERYLTGCTMLTPAT